MFYILVVSGDIICLILPKIQREIVEFVDLSG
jgi:hypothetical protein